MAIIKLDVPLLLLLLAIFNFVTSAPTAVQQANAVCVTGVPADAGTWPINYAAVVMLPTPTTAYDIDSTWAAAHALQTTSLSMNHSGSMDDYGAFKCQYTCNGVPGCVSFFGRYVSVNSTMEHFECVGFDEILDSSSCYTAKTANVPVGGYNKLC